MVKYDFPFVLLHFSILMVVVFFTLILKIKNKTQIHSIFLCNMGLVFIWNLGQLLEIYTRAVYGHTLVFFVYLYFIGVCFLPLSLLLTGLIFAHTNIQFKKWYYLLLIPPMFSYLILITNSLHHLFFIKYSHNNNELVYGKLFLFHNITTYTYIIIGLYHLIFFSIRNSGFFSKQSFLIFLGIVIPFSVNIAITYKIIRLPTYFTPIAFSFGIICFILAIIKYKFLNIVPIALQNIVDRISDSYIVINEKFDILDYNKPFVDTFSGLYEVNRNENFLDILNQNKLPDIDTHYLYQLTNKARKEKRSISFERHIHHMEFDKYFTIEITPIIANEKFIGTILLLKDITQSKRDLETIKENQIMLMERERLASLGQLIGGIAHNLKTPIMSISGGIEALKDLVQEYDDSIEDTSVTREDHHEIAQDMLTWLNKMKPYCSYMSDIITAVKGQAVQLNASSIYNFTLSELLKKVDVLMMHELKRNHCTLTINCQLDMYTELKGDVNNLVQILDNIIINAVQAYEGEGGHIDLIVQKKGSLIEFAIRDYAKGISDEIKDRLFREMLTTKGKNGTGLGLYMSYSTIKGKFGGNMWFDSEVGKGTTFYISIPYLSKTTNLEVS